MSADPYQPTEPLPPSPNPAAPEAGRPQPPPPAPGPGMPGDGGYGHDRYQTRQEPQPQYREQYEPAQQTQEWAPLPLYGQEMYTMTVAPKSPAVSVLLSVFIPGLGSMVNDNVGVGVAILILNIVGWILAIVLI